MAVDDDAAASVEDVARTPPKSPSKGRSLSDLAPTLSPSPRFREPSMTSKDDISVPALPITPRRPNFPIRGLSLQMPARDILGSNPSVFASRAPPSPKVDSSTTYASPSVLPRRSRGLDFSRACTNLHHSTLAEQSSPDLSPTLSGRGMMIPPRKGLANTSNMQESPGSNPSSLWSTMAVPDKAGMASSVGSVNMLESDSSSSSTDDEELLDPDDGGDPMITTPQVYKLTNPKPTVSATPYAAGTSASPGGDWMGRYSPAAASLMSFQRARLHKRRSRKSSSSASASASGGSTMASPSPASPPAMKSIETMGGYFVNDGPMKTGSSRRGSLSWGTKDLHLSSGGESDDGGTNGAKHSNDNNEAGPPVTPGLEEKRGVVRRPVTRRGNLLPKPKNFARIRAALMEEGAPVDSEVKREAEVVRQVRESDVDVDPLDYNLQPEAPDSSSPPMPAMPGNSNAVDELVEDEMMLGEGSLGQAEKFMPESFTMQAKRLSRGKDFWDHFDGVVRTPPPPLFPRASSSAVSDDASMESPSVSNSLSSSLPTTAQPTQLPQPPSRASTPQPMAPSAAEVSRKVNGKRRRDDDLDTNSFKRRAVSPGMSVQNSPVLSQSPGSKDGGWWGPGRTSRDVPPASNNGHGSNERQNSGSSTNGGNSTGTKRIGFQGMSDTNDGLMKMSIE